MTIEAVVFDMDGVLIDSEVVWRRVREAYAAERGHSWSADDQQALMGLSTPLWSERMRARLGVDDLSAAQLATLIIGRVRDAFEAELPVRTGAAQAIAAMREHWPLALASGSPRALMDYAMAKTGFADSFVSMLSGDDVKRGKPHPEIYQRTLERLGVAAHFAVGIEDSGNGLKALRAAGMLAIAAPGADLPLSAEAMALAHVQIASLEELTPQLVASLAGGAE